MAKEKVVIMGAAGRDFHDFNMLYKGNNNFQVVAFTATQIPGIANRKYPKELAGKGYPKGIPIYPEEKLPKLIKSLKATSVVFSYSDVSYNELMNKCSLVLANGADFLLPSVEKTMIKSKKPVIAITAVRTGAGKSPTTRRVIDLLKRLDMGMSIVVIRHPMPYGVLRKQEIERFSSMEDLELNKCTIEEMEEYEPHIARGTIVYAGVNYEKILRQAEKEADVIIWDGGNNDTPFIKPDLWICLTDCLRPGHEISYYPGEVNLTNADVVIANKATNAKPEDVKTVMNNINRVNPKATIMKGELLITVDNPEALKGKRALVIEDGPTLTHGGMTIGAGSIAAERGGAFLVTSRPYAKGSIKEVFNKYPKLGPILPAMGYSKKQIKELEETINATPCDIVVIGTPVDLRRHMKINKPAVRVTYTFKSLTSPGLDKILKGFYNKRVK